MATMTTATRREWLLLLALWGACAPQAESPTAHRPAAESQPPSSPVQPTGAPTTQSPRVVVTPPGHPPVSVRVEVARTAAERQRGLMFRERMDDDAGMVFLFERPQQQSFWMHNTYIPLDMIFIRSDMTVLGVVENAEPRTDDPRQVLGLSQYVLEVNAGFARRHGIGPGTTVRFENIEGVAP